MSTLARRLATCGVAIALLAGAVLGLADPHGLAGSGGWSLAIGGVLWGLGAAVRRALRISLRLGEQLLLGTVVWIFASGVLLALGIASRGPLFAVAGAGFAIALYELALRARRPPPAGPRPDTAHVLLGLALFAFLALNVLAMVATRGNPYDDQAAYTAFAKRLLDCGDLDEPFSFRRLSAYGGQTVLHALAALRGDVEAIDLLDRGIFYAIAVLLVLELAQRRRLHLSLTTGVVAFLLSLWDLNANSASTWTGFACFVGAYAFATRDDLPPRHALAITAAACAAACTLRQNYILPAGLFVIALLWFHLRARARESSWRRAWLAERTTLAITVATAIAVVAPYMIAAWTSAGSFLYPLFPGHANPALPLVPTGATLLDELRFFIVVVLNPEPIRVWWLLAPAMLLAKDPLDRRPWSALLIACGAGFVFLVHSFTLSDTFHLWRYAFAYMAALAVVFAIEAGGNLPVRHGETSPRVRVPAIAAFITWLAVLVHFVESRANPTLRFSFGVDNIKAALISGTRKADPYPGHYRELQQAVPAGESLAVLLDDPYHLDYRRNRIFNLDLPGVVAPPPGLPSFTTPAHWRAHLRGSGIRYLAFIDGRRSSWLYRRAGWLWRIYHDDELFRFIAAHMVDTLDTFEALAKTSRVVFDRDGFHVIDLGEAAPEEPPRGEPELVRMDRYARRLSEDELGNKTWQLASRRDVVFQIDNHGPTMIHPMPGIEPNADPTPLQALLGTRKEDPYRWLSDRTHLRVHGSDRHRLQAKLRIMPNRLHTIPTLVLHVDGVEIARGHPDPAGYIELDAPVSCEGWCDVYLVLSTVSEWWESAGGLRVMKLLELGWDPAP
jgi:hypothetical protein